MKYLTILFLTLFTFSFTACDNLTSGSDDNDNTTLERDSDDSESTSSGDLRLSVGDCMDFAPSAFMVAAPNPKKVPCGSEEAKSKITSITKDKSTCSEGYVTAYGSDEDKSYYCVEAL